ncbi:DUF3466 family protein [Alteromonas aestuariivivens]|uniref:DUF3466 family protein n=1 Tax=Alteromonas aestuariivivens TaxID=1938339 RepID=A0A3D8M8A9_9ALTE|nr:DUF3466 family protein [Alteromonas aestuariivivens]RDV25962.1 DUF3466 family protein [Alteromonas aestuariivivens]
MKVNQLAAAILLASSSATALAATYSVTPLPVQEFSKNNFGQSLDNSGFATTSLQYEFNPPIDVDRLDDSGFYSAVTLENEEDVKQGIFSDRDYTTIVNYLLTGRDSRFVQQLAAYRSYITDGVSYNLVPGLDEELPLFGTYSHSVNTLARDSLAGDYIVGTTEGVYKEVDYVDEEVNELTYTYNETLQQAYVQVNGVTHVLAPQNAFLNGISEAYAINNNLQVTGYGTTEVTDAIIEDAEECNDPELRGDEPVEICISDTRRSLAGAAQFRPHIWQLDATGNVIDLQTYPLVFTPEEDSTAIYLARAYDINDEGIAVGESMTGEFVWVTRPQSNPSPESELVATIYQNGETTELLPRDENIQSAANVINNNNWVAGYVTRAPYDVARNRLFVHNLDTGESRYPSGFFSGSQVTVKAINNNNMVVGKADVETSDERNRETHAYMYNIDTEEFVDLNTLQACDSPYTLLEAVDINDNNEILVNARFREPQTYVTGNEVLNSAGETVPVDNVIAVLMRPLDGGSIEECEADGGKYERQGAALSAWWLACFAGLAFMFRRKRPQLNS